MRNFKRTFVAILTLVFVLGAQLWAQNIDTSKSKSRWEEVKKMCNFHIDPAKIPMLKAKQDSMYKNYLSNLSRKKGLKKTMTIFPNWRPFMSYVKTQLAICTDYATTAVIEGQLQILCGSKIGNDGVDLNELEVPYAIRVDPTYVEDYIQNNKISSRVGSYPNLQGVKWTIASWDWVDIGIEPIKAALEYGPVTGCFEVYQDFIDFFYNANNRTKVYHHTYGPEVDGHAVAIVGYYEDVQDPDSSYWLCKNSWGIDFGDDGYFRIGFGECLIETIEETKVKVDGGCFAKLVPTLFSSLDDAFGCSWASGEQAYLLSGSQAFDVNASNLGGLTIQSGASVTFIQGSRLNFYPGSSIVVNGTLTANGTTFTSTSGNWGGIKFYHGSNGTLNYCDISNATYGVWSWYQPNLTLQNCQITNNTYGVFYEDEAEPGAAEGQIRKQRYGGDGSTQYGLPLRKLERWFNDQSAYRCERGGKRQRHGVIFLYGS
jgi:hypothetical protein